MTRFTSRLIGPTLALASLALCLIGLEIAARVWVAARWTPAELAAVTEPTGERAGYVGDPRTGYRLQPGFARVDAVGRRFTHSAAGFRGPDLRESAPESFIRILIAGASTVYGIWVDDAATSSARLESRLSADHPDREFEVLNLGVPGWTSRETVLRLEEGIESLVPDIVVLLDGRNEIFPQGFDGFRADYSHYRRLDWRIEAANLGWKRLFRASRLAMLLIHDPRGGVLGYSARDEDPVYGYVRYENRPREASAVVTNLEAAVSSSTWRGNLERLIERSRGVGADVVLVEMPFRKEAYGSGVLPLDVYPEAAWEGVRDALAQRVAANNLVSRELAGTDGVTYVEVDRLVDDAYLVDDCHFNEAGESELAAVLAEHMATDVLPGRRPRVTTRPSVGPTPRAGSP